MAATEQYIDVLMHLKPGDLGLLRTHAGRGLDESVQAFDLFAGIWWPLRQQKGGPPPRREVAWLIAKLYACRPLPQSPADLLACQLRRCLPAQEPARTRYLQEFDALLARPLGQIESGLRWSLDQIAERRWGVDWVHLAKDLGNWECESTRLAWAEQFLGDKERSSSC